jgi:hypothetical protein
MALYQLDEFKQLLASDNWCYFNRRLPIQTLDNLGWEDSDLLTMLFGLTDDDFQHTVENCKIENYLHADYVDADQYEIYWDTEELVRQTLITNTTLCMSLKIAIIKNEYGRICGIVSLKPSGSSWR